MPFTHINDHPLVQQQTDPTPPKPASSSESKENIPPAPKTFETPRGMALELPNLIGQEPPDAPDGEWPVRAITDVREVNGVTEFEVVWENDYVRARHIGYRLNKTMFVRCADTCCDVEILETNAGLLGEILGDTRCLVHFKDKTWRTRDRLRNAKKRIREFEKNRKVKYPPPEWTHEENALWPTLRPRADVDYRNDVLRRLRAKLDEMKPQRRLFSNLESVRVPIFRKTFIKGGGKVNFNREESGNAFLVQSTGYIQKAACLYCQEKGHGTYDGCVVHPGFACRACVNCVLARNGKSCGFRDDDRKF